MFDAKDSAHYRQIWATLTSEEQERLKEEARGGDPLAHDIMVAVATERVLGQARPNDLPGEHAGLDAFREMRAKLAQKTGKK